MVTNYIIPNNVYFGVHQYKLPTLVAVMSTTIEGHLSCYAIAEGMTLHRLHNHNKI